MFFRKTERKKHSACVILTIGALAAIGAVSITRSGKQMLSDASAKIRGFFKKEMCECNSECGE